MFILKMCDDSDQEISELDIQLRTWKKLEKNMKSVGFREGAAEGKNLSLQEGFNLGYSDGFRLGEYIGMCRGIVRCESEIHLPDTKKSNFNELNLDLASNEACVLCSKESSITSTTKNTSPENTDDLISTQQCYNNEVIKTIQKSNIQYLEER